MAAISSTGTTTCRSSGLRAGVDDGDLMIAQHRQNRAIVKSGRWVADSPIRWIGGTSCPPGGVPRGKVRRGGRRVSPGMAWTRRR